MMNLQFAPSIHPHAQASARFKLGYGVHTSRYCIWGQRGPPPMFPTASFQVPCVPSLVVRPVPSLCRHIPSRCQPYRSSASCLRQSTVCQRALHNLIMGNTNTDGVTMQRGTGQRNLEPPGQERACSDTPCGLVVRHSPALGLTGGGQRIAR
jgi:hypothetical protein